MSIVCRDRGESVTAERYTQEMGGKGLNVAVGLARLRRQPEGVAALIGCGRDAAGDALLDLLKAEGLDAAHVSRLPGTSGMGSGLIGPDGENQIAVAPGANALLTAAHVDAAAASWPPHGWCMGSSRLRSRRWSVRCPSLLARVC